MMKKFNSKTMKYGTNATILTALFIVIVIVLNVAVGMLTERFPSIKIDLSANNMFGISDQTRDAMASLSQEVQIILPRTSDGESAMYNEILDRYRELSPHISYSYVNVTKDPTFLQKYSGGTNPIGAFIVESGPRYEIVSASDVQGKTGRFETAENALTNAILSVTAAEKKVIYFTAGHDEPEYKTLTAIAEQKYFDVKQVNLKQEAPDSGSMLVICSPQNDFTMGEIDAVDTFVKKGGNLQIYLDPSAPYLPNFCEYIKEWGIEVKNEVVNESDTSFTVPQYGGFIPTVAKTSYQSSITSLILCSPALRLDILYSNERGVTSEAVLTTSSKGTATPAGSSQASEPDVFNLAVQTTRVLDDMSEVTMFISGSPLNLTQEYQQQYAGNAQLSTTLFSKMLKSEHMVEIPDKTVEVQAVSMSFAGVVAIAVVVVIIALGVLIFGIVIFLRRRRL